MKSTLAPLQLISEWVSGGVLTEYAEWYPGAAQPGLVGQSFPMYLFDPLLTSIARDPTSLEAFTFSAPATYLMPISREYVIV